MTNKRSTPVYKALINIFESHSEPVSNKEVIRLLKKSGLSPNRTTIYRQIEKLTNEGIIRRVRIDEKSSSYEKAASHHHHVICKSCDKVEDVTLKEDPFLEKEAVSQAKGFKILNHSLEFYGICRTCLVKA